MRFMKRPVNVDSKSGERNNFLFDHEVMEEQH